jgi:hypothetical protein
MSAGSYVQRWLVGHPHDGCLINVSRQFDVVRRCCHVGHLQTAEDRKRYSSTVSYSSPHALTQGHSYWGVGAAATLGSKVEGAEQQIF